MVSQQEVALLDGITPKYLSAIKHGKKDASKKLAIKLGKRFGTSPDLWIFGRADERIAAIDNIISDFKQKKGV